MPCIRVSDVNKARNCTRRLAFSARADPGNGELSGTYGDFSYSFIYVELQDWRITFLSPSEHIEEIAGIPLALEVFVACALHSWVQLGDLQEASR